MPPNPPQGHRYVPREESPLEKLRRERDALREAIEDTLADWDAEPRPVLKTRLERAIGGPFP